ncbi:MAG: tRNA (adenosine(37)-N6)-dimethylallyltransferase MiaA [Bacillota bacterium]
MKKPLLIIVGPTAVGKTEISIEIAKRLDCEIVSSDSMQIYKYMDIGSAKPSKEEMQGVPHYLVDEIDPRTSFSAAQYQKLAFEYINDIHQRGKLPMVVGGTGLYVNSIIYDVDFTSTVSNWDLRKQLEQEAKEFGNEYLHNKLKEVDQASADRIHPNNVKRVIRALEVFYESGEKIKDFSQEPQKRPDFDYLFFGLIRDRDDLYDRINRRVDILMEKGLVEEVRHLTAMGLDEKDISMKGLGYKEIIKYIKGEYTYEEAVYTLKRDTRHYAKRQITWFKRYDDLKWINIGDYSSHEGVINVIMEEVKGKFRKL